MKPLGLIYCGAVLLFLCVCGVTGCSQKKREEAVENTSNAIQRAYDKTTQVLKNIAESINDAVYK